MTKISDNLTQVRKRIQATAQKAGRSTSDVTLLAVSKTQGELAIREAYAAGQRDFGENYLQEAEQKRQQLSDLDLSWHFIGSIQSNKAKTLARAWDWVHCIDRIKVAEILNRHRPENLDPLNVCLQVNIDNEASKSGCKISETGPLALAVSKLKRLRLRGLMVVPAAENSARAFKHTREVRDKINETYKLNLDTLSMGMSADLDEAIHCDATIVRVGTAIFGARRK